MDDENIANKRSLDISAAAQKNESDPFDDGELDDEGAISAPIEVLAEFLSAVMSRRYKDALHYCSIILQYEPNNKTAREFYPLIEEKLELDEEPSKNDNEGDSDENDNYSAADNGKTVSFCSQSSSSDHDDEIVEDSTSELSKDLQMISI